MIDKRAGRHQRADAGLYCLSHLSMATYLRTRPLVRQLDIRRTGGNLPCHEVPAYLRKEAGAELSHR